MKKAHRASKFRPLSRVNYSQCSSRKASLISEMSRVPRSADPETETGERPKEGKNRDERRKNLQWVERKNSGETKSKMDGEG